MGIREKLKWLDPFTYVDILLEKINPGHNPLVDWPAYLVSAFVFAWLLYVIIGVFFGTSMPIWIIESGSMEPLLYRGDIIFLAGSNVDSINAQTVSVDFPLGGKAFADFAFAGYDTSGYTKNIVFKGRPQESFEINTQGDIVIYFSQYLQLPIIHRVVLKIIAPDGTFLLTKGDSIKNPTIDQDCGSLEKHYVIKDGETVAQFRPTKPCINLFPVSTKELKGKMLFNNLKIPLLGYVKLLVFDDTRCFLFDAPRGRKCYFP